MKSIIRRAELGLLPSFGMTTGRTHSGWPSSMKRQSITFCIAASFIFGNTTTPEAK